MSVFHRTMSAGLIALTLACASLATSAPAEARDHGAFWGGLAAGTLGGIVGGALLSQEARPVYAYPAPAYYPAYRPAAAYYPAYRPAPAPAYVYDRPSYCHTEWRHNDWGQAYRVQVCPE